MWDLEWIGKRLLWKHGGGMWSQFTREPCVFAKPLALEWAAQSLLFVFCIEPNLLGEEEKLAS